MHPVLEHRVDRALWAALEDTVPQTQMGISSPCVLAADRNLVEVQRFERMVKRHLTRT